MSDRRMFGYVRVSSRTQNEARQVAALEEYGVDKRDIFIDKTSGKNFERPKYQTMKSLLQEGDIVVLLDLDRLGRNYSEMASEWQNITKEKGCDIEIINLPILNTNQKKETLDTRFLADMIFSILSYVAERERQDIKARQKEGIEVAKRNGTKFGRPTIERPSNFDEVYNRVKKHEITNRKAMELLNLKPNTYYRFANEIQ